MADRKYDAVFIGGGNKGLVLAMYLAKYGGMKVGIFEARHELGGGWSSAELPLPGFIHDTHSSCHYGKYYHGPVWDDFPEWEEKGAKYVLPPKTAKGLIFSEDHSCLVFYNEMYDPSQERTAHEIARFSQRDADTWLHWWKLWQEKIGLAYMQYLFNPAPPQGQPSSLDKILEDPDLHFEPIHRIYSGIQFFNNMFESQEMRMFGLKGMRGGAGIAPDYPMGGLQLFLTMFYFQDAGFIKGGGHSLAHASIRVIMENGGEFFTNSEVDKVIIEKGEAKGIRLVDGTEVEATQAVISGLDPTTLCFRLIGKEHLSHQINQRIDNIVRNQGTITWNGWAVKEKADYRAADFNPDINETFLLQLVDKDPEQLCREYAWRRLGKFPPPEDSSTLVVGQSLFDDTRAPDGLEKYTLETFVIPADLRTEKEWLAFKKEKVIVEQGLWESFAPNMTWDNIVDVFVNSPYDTIRLKNMAPSGEEHVISAVPSQVGSFRPIPELAQHRTPINKLYATGAAWPPQGIATSWQGYNCYKIMADDYKLRKPWEEMGRLY